MQDMKSLSSESVASSSHKLDHLEKKLTSVAAKQEEIDVQLKIIVAYETKTLGFRI